MAGDEKIFSIPLTIELTPFILVGEGQSFHPNDDSHEPPTPLEGDTQVSDTDTDTDTDLDYEVLDALPEGIVLKNARGRGLSSFAVAVRSMSAGQWIRHSEGNLDSLDQRKAKAGNIVTHSRKQTGGKWQVRATEDGQVWVGCTEPVKAESN